MIRAPGFDPVLVTGAAGFVGAAATNALVEHGHVVHVLLRSSSNPWRLAAIRQQIQFHTVDVHDAPAVARVFREVQPKAVLHLATHGAYEKQADPRAILGTNILGTYNLLEAAAECGARVFVNTGSSSEYGYKSAPMRESDRLEPNSYYSIAKAAQTHLCAFAATRWPLGVAVFRLFSVYGPWEEPARLIPTVIRRARAGLPLEMVARDVARDFVYVDDVVRALVDFEQLQSIRGEVFNLGSGVETKLEDVVGVVQDLVGRGSAVKWGAMVARQWDTNRWCADPSQTRARLGWSATVSFREGVARMAAWMSEHGDAYGPALATRAA